MLRPARLLKNVCLQGCSHNTVHIVENVVDERELAFGDAVLVVVGPALDDGIESVDEPGLE
jgi:hypothetical protein